MFDSYILNVLHDVFHTFAYVLLLIFVINKYIIKKDEKGLWSITWVVLTVVLIASISTVIQVTEKLSDSLSTEFHGDGIEYVANRVEYNDERMEDIQDDDWFSSPYESISYVFFTIGNKGAYYVDKLAYSIRDLVLTTLVLIGPLVLAMGLYDAHKGKIIIYFGFMFQAAFWSSGWVFMASILGRAIGGVADAGLTKLLVVSILWVFWVIFSVIIVILAFQKFWEMGIAVGSSGASFSGGIGKGAQIASTTVRGGKTTVMSGSRAAGTAAAGVSALASGGASLARKSINRVRRGGIITPRPPKSNIIT